MQSSTLLLKVLRYTTTLMTCRWRKIRSTLYFHPLHMEIINLLSFPQLKQCITEGYVTATLPISSMGELLITGGAGFIGSCLAKKSLESGWKVRIYDTIPNGLDQTLAELEDAGVKLIIGDIRNPETLNDAISGCDTVVHLAAQVSVPHSIINPQETMDVNVNGTAQVLELCLLNGVERVVMASSAAVYGNSENFPLHEDDAGMTLSPYAESKWMNEKQIIDARQKGLNAAALRFFNVYGNGQKSDGAYSAVIPKFIDLMLNGKTPIVNGDGLQTRDFVHVDDVCTAVLSLIEDDWKAVNHHVFNVATQTKISLLDLIDTINQILVKVNHLSISIDPVFGPSRKGDIQHSLADIQRMKNTFNWKPKVDLQRGLEDMIHSRKANR